MVIICIFLGCNVWKFERTDIPDLNDYGVPLSKLQDEQEFVVEGATLRLCLVSDILEPFSVVTDGCFLFVE